MIRLKKGLASLAVGLALTALASPSYAQEGHFQISRERAQALHECSRLLARYPEYLWGNTGRYQWSLHGRTWPAGISRMRIARIKRCDCNH
jgi:hypothetical protein